MTTSSRDVVVPARAAVDFSLVPDKSFSLLLADTKRQKEEKEEKIPSDDGVDNGGGDDKNCQGSQCIKMECIFLGGIR